MIVLNHHCTLQEYINLCLFAHTVIPDLFLACAQPSWGKSFIYNIGISCCLCICPIHALRKRYSADSCNWFWQLPGWVLRFLHALLQRILFLRGHGFVPKHSRWVQYVAFKWWELITDWCSVISQMSRIPTYLIDRNLSLCMLMSEIPS